MTRVPIVYSPKYFADLHGHVFPIQKYRMVCESLLASGWIGEDDLIEPSPATREDLLLVHTPAYLEDLFDLVVSRRTIRSEMALDRGIVDAFNLAVYGEVTLDDAQMMLARRSWKRLRSPRQWPARLKSWFFEEMV